jgi:hypothetical protein
MGIKMVSVKSQLAYGFSADEQLFGEEQPNDHSIEQAQGHNDDRESVILIAYQSQTAHGCNSHWQGRTARSTPATANKTQKHQN